MYLCASYLQIKSTTKNQKEMAEEKTTTNPRAGAQLTGRVTQETLAKFKEIQEAESFETFGQFVESLLMHYYDPVKVNKENEAEIKQLKKQVEELKLDLENTKNSEKAAYDALKEANDKQSALQIDFDALRAEFNGQGAAIERLKGENHRYDGHIAVPVNELDMRCLEWLADRENKRRKREDITPPVFFQFAVRELLIKGNKFAIDSVPDSVIAQFEKEIKNGR